MKKEDKQENILRAASVGKGTIYEYFDNKEALFIQMIKYNVSYVINDLSASVDQSYSMQELQDRFVQTCIHLIEKHSSKLKVYFQIHVEALGEMHVWLLEKHEQIRAKLTRVIEQCMANDKNATYRTVKPDVLAWLLINTVQLGFFYKIEKPETDTEAIIKAQMDIIFHGIKEK